MPAKARNPLVRAMLAALIITATIASKTAATSPPVQSDILYGTFDGYRLMGDFYPPADAASPAPALVLVHGGGFVQGDKAQPNAARLAQYLADHGYAVFSINYRLTQDGGVFPNNVHDVKCAVKWFRSRADEFGVDPARTGILGMSAGGYLASFVATTRYTPEFSPASCGDPRADAQQPEVPFAVIWYGIHNLSTLNSITLASIQSSLLKGLPPKKALLAKASAATYLKDAPPMILLHGVPDALVPVTQSRNMCKELRAASLDCTYVEYPDSGHGFLHPKTGDDTDFASAMAETVKWLDIKVPKK